MLELEKKQNISSTDIKTTTLLTMYVCVYVCVLLSCGVIISRTARTNDIPSFLSSLSVIINIILFSFTAFIVIIISFTTFTTSAQLHHHHHHHQQL